MKFEKLHKLLWDEEASRIVALREEEAQKNLMLKKMIEKTTLQISSVLESIKQVEKDLAGDDLPFLLVKSNFISILRQGKARQVYFCSIFHTWCQIIVHQRIELYLLHKELNMIQQ